MQGITDHVRVICADLVALMSIGLGVMVCHGVGLLVAVDAPVVRSRNGALLNASGSQA